MDGPLANLNQDILIPVLLKIVQWFMEQHQRHLAIANLSKGLHILVLLHKDQWFMQ